MSDKHSKYEQRAIVAFSVFPKEISESDYTSKEILTWFIDPNHKTIAKAFLDQIDAGEVELAEFMALDALESGAGSIQNHKEIYDSVKADNEVTDPLQALKQLESSFLNTKLFQGLDKLRKCPTDGVDYIEAVSKISAEILHRYSGEKIEVMTAKEISDRTILEIAEAYEAYQKEGKIDGLRCGVGNIDKELGPVREGQFMAIAGRPGAGKSALMFHYIHSALIVRDEPSLIFNFELPVEEQGARMMSQLGRSGQSIETIVKLMDLNLFNYNDQAKTASKFSKTQGFFVKNDEVTLEQIEKLVWKYRRERKIKNVFVDYLSLVRKDTQEKDNEFFGRVARKFKIMAKRWGIRVIACAQLNRESERNNRLPRLHDLADSGGIEKNADKVVGLWAKRAPEDQQEDCDYWILPDRSIWVKAKIMKNRQGAVGAILDTKFFGESGIFKEKLNHEK